MRKSKIALLALVLLASLIPILPYAVEAPPSVNLVTEDERWTSYNVRISESIYFIMVEMNAPLVVGQHDLFRSEDAGETWENMGCVSETYGSNESLSAASMAVDTLDNNLVHITWQGYGVPTFIQKTIWNNTAEAFQQNVEVVAQRGYIHWMEIDSNNVLHIAWDDMVTNASVVAHANYRNSTDRGDNWNTIETLDTNSWGDWFINLQLLVTRNNVVNIAWRENDPGAKNHRYMYCRRFTNGTWVSPEDTAGSFDSTHPGGGWDWSSDPADRLIRTYHNGSSGFTPITGADIYTGYTTEATNYTGALAWSEPTAIGSGKVFIQDPSIQVDDSGAAHIICQEWLDGWVVGDFPNPVPGNISLHYMKEEAFPWNNWESPVRLNYWHSQCGFGFFRGSQYPLINRVDSTATLDFMFMVWQGVSAEYDIYYQLLSLIVSVSGSITDMDADNWLFAETKFYSFVANATLLNTYLDVMQMRFSDGYNTIQFYFKNSTTDYVEVIGDSGTYIHLRLGSVETGDSWVSVTFEVYLTNRIIDVLDVDLWVNANATTGEEFGWTEVQHDYFNIYNFGGQALGSLTVTGDAGRLTGGDIFDFYARNGSSVEASMIYRNLQHVKFLNDMFFNIYYTGYNLTYQMDYLLEGDSDFIEGWRVDIATVGLAHEATYVWQDFTLHWFNRGEWIKSENISCNHGPGAAQGANTTSKLWVDLWFNTINASTTIGLRVNAYEFPMTDSSPWWYRWFSTNWGPDPRYGQTKTLFTDLLDANNNTISTQRIELVRVKVILDVWELGLGDSYVTVSHPQTFDKTFCPINQPFQGIQTPAIDETLIPKVTQRGIVGAVWSAFRWLADSLGRTLGPSVLGFWNTFIGFLDTIAASVGVPYLFTNIITWILSFWDWLIISMTSLLTFLTSMFLIWVEVGTKGISTFSQMATQWISMIQQVFILLDTGMGYGVGIWEQLNLTAWLILFAIIYPVILLGIWEEEGFDVMCSHIMFIINVIAFVVHGLLTIAQFGFNLIHYLIESIPVVE